MKTDFQGFLSTSFSAREVPTRPTQQHHLDIAAQRRSSVSVNPCAWEKENQRMRFGTIQVQERFRMCGYAPLMCGPGSKKILVLGMRGWLGISES
jgi:hypothetical protein